MAKTISGKDGATTTVIRVTLRQVDFDLLTQLAEEQYRTPELQVGYMIALALRGQNMPASDLANDILTRAAARRAAANVG
jgi:hypothetical protein